MFGLHFKNERQNTSNYNEKVKFIMGYHSKYQNSCDNENITKPKVNAYA
jgi:hypothetical protein